jgi:hypothetical protein
MNDGYTFQQGTRNRAMRITIDTLADDYISQHGIKCIQSIVGELHLTDLIKF